MTTSGERAEQIGLLRALDRSRRPCGRERKPPREDPRKTHWPSSPRAARGPVVTTPGGSRGNPIDAFIAAGLRKRALYLRRRPIAHAGRASISSSHGLPPTPQQVEASWPTRGPTPTSARGGAAGVTPLRRALARHWLGP